MNEGERLATLISVIQMLTEALSWTGRMHIQKLVYFAQNLLHLPTEYEFVLYQRGPYSFELDADIRLLRATGAVDISPAPPYGPSYFTTPLGEEMGERSPITKELSDQLKGLAQRLGPKTAADLELLATAHYAVSEGYQSEEGIVKRVVSLKPQFSPVQVSQALEEVRELQAQFG